MCQCAEARPTEPSQPRPPRTTERETDSPVFSIASVRTAMAPLLEHTTIPVRRDSPPRPFGRARHLAQTLITRESFWTRLSSESPCLMVAWYCAFFVSGRVEETMPLTLSMEHERRPAEMNCESSTSR